MFILFFSIAVSSIISTYYIMYLSVCLWSIYISIHLLKYFHLFLENPFMVYLSNYYYHLSNILHTHILLSVDYYLPFMYHLCTYMYQSSVSISINNTSIMKIYKEDSIIKPVLHTSKVRSSGLRDLLNAVNIASKVWILTPQKSVLLPLLVIVPVWILNIT